MHPVGFAIRSFNVCTADKVHHLVYGTEALIGCVLVFVHDELVSTVKSGASYGRWGTRLVCANHPIEGVEKVRMRIVDVPRCNIIRLSGPMDLIVVFDI